MQWLLQLTFRNISLFFLIFVWKTRFMRPAYSAACCVLIDNSRYTANVCQDASLILCLLSQIPYFVHNSQLTQYETM